MKHRTRNNSKQIKQSGRAGISFLQVVILFIVGWAMGWVIHDVNDILHQPQIENKASEMTIIPQELLKKLPTESPSETYRVPILIYHYVEYVTDKRDTIRKSLDITPDVFESQVLTLENAGYTFLTAADLAGVFDNVIPLPEKPVLLTFDDGYRDFYTDVFPILKKFRAKATAYIIPGFLDQPNYMFTNQLKEVAASGLVDIGAHTVHHVYLKNDTYAKAKAEIDDSKKMLENLLHLPVVSFAYPYGAFDQQTLSLVKAAGFYTAVSTIPGVDISRQKRFYLNRIRPGSKSGEQLTSYLEQYRGTN